MKEYSIWNQVLNYDGSVNNEDVAFYCETLEEARIAARDGQVIRYYPGCDSDFDWDAADETGWKEWIIKDRKCIKR